MLSQMSASPRMRLKPKASISVNSIALSAKPVLIDWRQWTHSYGEITHMSHVPSLVGRAQAAIFPLRRRGVTCLCHLV